MFLIVKYPIGYIIHREHSNILHSFSDSENLEIDENYYNAQEQIIITATDCSTEHDTPLKQLVTAKKPKQYRKKHLVKK